MRSEGSATVDLRGRRGVRSAWRIGAVLCPLAMLPVGGCVPRSPPRNSLEAETIDGAWYDEPRFEGQTGHIGLQLATDSAGRTIGRLAMLDIDVRGIAIGVADVDGDSVTIGPLTATWDRKAGTLSGTLPEALVPVHRIPFTLRRVERLPDPAPAVETAVPTEEPEWVFRTGGAIWAGIAAGDRTLFVGSDDHRVHALDALRGTERWQFETGGAIRSRPTLIGDAVLVSSDDGFVYCLATADGAVRWKARAGEMVRRTTPGASDYAYDSYGSSPTAWGGTVYVGSGNDVVALDAGTGELRWRHSTAGAVATTPAVMGSRVYAGSFDGRVYALDTRTGEVEWTYDFGGPVTSSPALLGDLVVVGSRSYDLVALHASDGTPAWSRYEWFSWVESSPTVAGGDVYVGSSDAQKLHALDGGTGRARWSFDTGGSAWAQPLVSTTRVYVGSVGVAHYIVDHRATFWAVDRSTGRPVWKFDLAPPPDAALWGWASSPAMDEDRVFVGALNGSVYAFAR